MMVQIHRDDGAIKSYWGVTDITKTHDENWLLFVESDQEKIVAEGELYQTVDRCAYDQSGIDRVLSDHIRLDKFEVEVHEWWPGEVPTINRYATHSQEDDE